LELRHFGLRVIPALGSIGGSGTASTTSSFSGRMPQSKINRLAGLIVPAFYSKNL